MWPAGNCRRRGRGFAAMPRGKWESGGSRQPSHRPWKLVEQIEKRTRPKKIAIILKSALRKREIIAKLMFLNLLLTNFVLKNIAVKG